MVAKTGTQSHWERWLEMEGVLLENKEETVVIDTGISSSNSRRNMCKHAV